MKIALPITQVLHAFSLPNLHQRASQQPLTPFPASHGLRPGPLQHGPSTVITGPENLMHTTRFSLGTPAQMFTAILDFGSADLVVPSGELSKHCTHDCPSRYNSSESTTYRPNGTEIDSRPLAENVTGFLSEDDFRISDLLIQRLLFEESPTMQLDQRCIGCDMPFDTVLPLGPYNASNPRNFMSPVAQLVERGLLDQNLFSLRLSRDNDGDGDGALLLGGVLDKDLYDTPTDRFITIPVTDNPIPDIDRLDRSFVMGDKWKADISYIALGDGSSVGVIFRQPCVATFETTFPWIAVPISFANSLNSFMDAETWGPFAWVDCSKRAEWPNITIRMGGESFVLTPYDYTLEQVYSDEPPGRLNCMSAFVLGFEPDEGGLVVLGSSFLKPWVSVWDLDGRNMSFVRAKHGVPRERLNDHGH